MAVYDPERGDNPPEAPPSTSPGPVADGSRRWTRPALALVALTLLYGGYQIREYLVSSRQYAVAASAVRLYSSAISVVLHEYWATYGEFPVSNEAVGLPDDDGGAWPEFRRVAVTSDGRTIFEYANSSGGPEPFTLVIAAHPSPGIGSWVYVCGGAGVRPKVGEWLSHFCAWDSSINSYAPVQQAAAPGVHPTRSNATPGATTRDTAALPARPTTPADEVIEAVGRDDPAALAKLRERGLDLCAADPEGQTPLAAAVRGNQQKTLPVLIAAACDLNRIEPVSARTPLMIAAAARDIDLTRQLLAAGADPNVVNANGDSAWFLVGTEGGEASEQIRSMLLVKGADINALGGAHQGTLLMRAAATGNLRLAEWLIGRGAKLDLQDNAGRSALMHATLSPNGETVLQLLVNRGADLKLKDAQGNTALSLAQTISDTARRERIIKALLAARGKSS